jgi:phage terminase small subunit
MGNQQLIPGNTEAHTETTALTEGPTLTVKQEAFAQAVAAGMHRVDAYLGAYGAISAGRGAARVAAHRLANKPAVARRIRALQDQAGALAMRSTQDLVADLEAAAFADPNELVTLLNGACRFCWGAGGAYHWRSVSEFTDAVEAVARENAGVPPELQKPLPDFNGGPGYTFHREANPDCCSCDGVGLNRVRFNSSQDVSHGARALLRGIELHGDGSLIRIHLHDQLQMRQELHKLRGMHVDRSVSVNVNANVPAFEQMTPQDKLDFLASLGPRK